MLAHGTISLINTKPKENSVMDILAYYLSCGIIYHIFNENNCIENDAGIYYTT